MAGNACFADVVRIIFRRKEDDEAELLESNNASFGWFRKTTIHSDYHRQQEMLVWQNSNQKSVLRIMFNKKNWKSSRKSDFFPSKFIKKRKMTRQRKKRKSAKKRKNLIPDIECRITVYYRYRVTSYCLLEIPRDRLLSIRYTKW